MRLSRVVAGLVISAAFLLVAAVVLTRTPLCKVWLLPVIGNALGVRVEAESARVEAGGTVVLEKAVFILPGVEGPAARFLSVDRLEVDPDFGRGGVPISRMRVDGAVLRVSQAVDADTVNLQAWNLPSGGRSPGPRGGRTSPPRIDLRGATVELGEHEGETYRVLKRIGVRGSVVPETGTDAWAIDLRELDPGNPTRVLEGGMSVSGRLDDTGLRLTMTRASLASWPASEVPRRYRDVFELLELEGDLARAYLELPWDGQVEAGIVVQDVAMSLPFEARGGSADGDVSPMRMTRTGGRITFVGSGVRARLEGWIEDLPYSVELDYRGLSEVSPFRCEMTTTGYQLSERPRLAPFMPEDVLHRLADFRAPTGLVDASVVIERGEAVAAPDGPAAAPTVFHGTIKVTEGRAAFHVFPYPFERMEALVTFDQEQVRIERITGVNSSGARLVASGLVTPLGDEAEVTIRVGVTGAPVDEQMREAMGPDRAPLLDAIFSRERLAELESAGLLLSSGTRDALMGERERLNRALAELDRRPGQAARREARSVRDALVELERRLRVPGFELAGLADVNVLVHRLPGPGNVWESTVEIDLARAGVLSRHFPMPVEAGDVRFVVRDRDLTLERGRFVALGGGEVSASVRALLPGRETPGEAFVPDVRIVARGLTLSPLLAHAITRAGEPGGAGQGATWGQGLCEAELGGRVDAEAHVLVREGGGLGFDVEARFARARAMTAAKPDADERIGLADLAGRVRANEREAVVSLEAQAQTLAPSLGATASQGDVARPAGRVGVEARIGLGQSEGGGGAYDISVEGADVISDAPVERLVGLISPEVESLLARWRERYDPRGRVGGVVRVEGTLGHDDATVSVGVRQADGASVVVDLGALGSGAGGDGRLGLSDVTGTLDLTMPGVRGAGSLRAEAFGALLTLEGASHGRVGLDGSGELVTPTDSEGMVGVGAMDLRVTVDGARLESVLLRWALRAFVADAGAVVGVYDPSGAFDASVRASRASAGDEAQFEAQVRPSSLGLTFEGQRLSFDTFEGALWLSNRGGEARGVRASSPAYTIGGDATWTRWADGQIALDATVWGDAPSLSAEVRALLPAGVRGALDQVRAQADGPISLAECVVQASWPAGQEAGVRASGVVSGSGMSADVGVDLEQARGSIRFETRAGPGTTTSYGLGVTLDSVRAAGLLLSGVRAQVRSGEREGEVLVPMLQGEAYGGRVAGSGRMVRARRDGSALQYDLTLQASGVRFASLLEDRAPRGRGPRATQADGPEAPDASRGVLAAEVSLGGIVGDDGTRRGRGSIQVGGGPVVALPLLMPIIEVSNLRLPASTQLDVAFADFYILGDRVTFEDMSAFTRAVEIWGYGTMDWGSQRLDMRFNTRSTAPIPVVSELIEGVRNELISTRVRGTLGDPDVGTIQFSGTRTVLDTLLGDGPSEQQRRLAEIGERAHLNRTRALRAGERLRWLVASQMESQAPSTGP